MTTDEKDEFSVLLQKIYSYYGRDLSPQIAGMWWSSLKNIELSVIKKALNEHVRTPVSGSFIPKIADMVLILIGTNTDRSLIAWGKVMEAMQLIGAYKSVVFDDPAIHAAIEDHGGWPKMCRTETKDLSYLQHRFCASHKAYTGRKTFAYPHLLAGDSDLKRFGFEVVPVLIGDPSDAAMVYQSGARGAKTQMTIGAMAQQALRIGGPGA